MHGVHDLLVYASRIGPRGYVSGRVEHHMSRNKDGIWYWLIILGAVVTPIGIVLEYAWPFSETNVSVHNTGHTVIQSVVIHIGRRSYYIGDIAPDSSASIDAKSYIKEDVDVEFVTEDGKQQRLHVGHFGGLDGADSESIRFQLKDGEIVGSEHLLGYY